MKTSPTTSEHPLRGALLDVVHGQWRELGAPLSGRVKTPEVIDADALLWASLEFYSSSPRLAETIRAWLSSPRAGVNRQRVNKLARLNASDPRAQIWHSLDDGAPLTSAPKPLGALSAANCTLLVRARRILGSDCRHFLIVHLLATPGGARLRDIAAMSGYSYRNLASAADDLHDERVLRLDRGFAVLTDPTPWCRILACEPQDIALVDWSAAYRAAIEFLRTLSKAGSAGLPRTHTLLASAAGTARESIAEARRGVAPALTPSLSLLYECAVAQ